MICPLMSEKQRIERLKQYPRFVRLMYRSLSRFWKNHPNAKVVTEHHENVYQQLARDIFGTEHKYSLFMRDFKKELEDFFKIELY